MIQLCHSLGYHVSCASFPLKNDLPIDSQYNFKRPSMALASRLLRKVIGASASLLNSGFLTDKLYESRWGLKKIQHDLKRQNFALIVVEDLQLLSLAFKIKNNAKVIFDAREYYPLQLENSLFWRLTEKRTRVRFCRTYLPLCDSVMTVSPGLVAKYKQEFKIDPVLIRSMPNYVDHKPTSTDAHNIKMVHHGVANYNRKLENIVEAMRHVDQRYSLDFYLTGSTAYQNKLKEMAKDLSNVHFLEPIEFTKIIPTLNQYDIGFCFIYPSTFNLKYCLPNKLFEFIQSRLAVVSGPLVDVEDIIKTHETGFVSDSFEPKDMADLLNRLESDDIIRAKKNSHKAAKSLNYEEESQHVKTLIDQLIGKVS
jgi:glycosyltransferase involved in cell wall biosynthesis